MADSYWTGTTPGGVAVFAVPFPYIQQSDVEVQLNGVTLLTPGDYVWNTSGSIQISPTPPEGLTLTIARDSSPDSADVVFTNGANLTAADLNTAFLQCFYRTQELQDQLNSYINGGMAQFQITGALTMTPQQLIDAAAQAALQSDLAQTLLNAQNDINTNAESILTASNQISTLQGVINNLVSTIPGGIGTYLTNETNSRIAGDQALQTQLNALGAVSGDSLSFILNQSTVYVDPTTSMADYFAGLESQVAGNTAAITSEATTRAAADSAQSTLITGLQASLATTNGNVSANTAAIATQASAQATTNSTVASQITSLTSQVGSNTTSISQQLSSINGLQAQYVVKLDNNGHVAGFGLASGAGGTSNFTVLANNFSVIDPGNGSTSPTVPFTIQNGVCYMQNVVIAGALIESASITGAQIAGATIGTANIANAAITTALIANAAVTTATIANLAVTNAHIANLAVGSSNIQGGAVQTGHIAANAVSNDASVVQSGIQYATTSAASVIGISYTSQGGKLLILARADISATGVEGTGNPTTTTVNLMVGSTVYDSMSVTGTATVSTSTTVVGSFSGMSIIQPAAGTYEIQLEVTNTAGSELGEIANGKIFVIEFYK